jgi:hypothetical protein
LIDHYDLDNHRFASKLTMGIKLDDSYAKVALSSCLVLLSKANVMICGSGVIDGLYRICIDS